MIVKIKSTNSVSLSIKIPLIFCIKSNWCPDSPSTCTCAVIVCKIALVYCNIRSKGSIEFTIAVVYLSCKPIQLTGVRNLVYVFSVFHCRLVMAIIIPAETVVVPVMLNEGFILVVGVAINSTTTVLYLFINLSTGAVQNRIVILADSLIECDLRLITVQQVADFAVLKLFCGFAHIIATGTASSARSNIGITRKNVFIIITIFYDACIISDSYNTT